MRNTTAAALLVLGIACACEARPVPVDTLTCSEGDNGKTFVVRQGTRVVFRVSAQLGTGYGWRLAPYDSSRIGIEGDSVVERSAETGPGKSEIQVFYLRALRRGRVAVTLEYVRPWEKPPRPLKRLRITLRVK